MGLLGWVVIGFLAGAAARAVAGGASYGCLTTILLGVLGAVVGGIVFNAVGADSEAILSGALGSFITAFFGAVLVLLALRLVSPRRRR
ncbi:MAG: GlsB/YeaQ/YmgE family stress response membrane protein [Acidimicrobiia bacterium]|nr:GlsB/YeaQ/YmgE family stress response membrane protein [Acidimicrobiia bacterium]